MPGAWDERGHDLGRKSLLRLILRRGPLARYDERVDFESARLDRFEPYRLTALP